MTPRTAIVVATRDRRELVLRSTARHLALPDRPPVCVVDDASTDGTAAALRGRRPGVTVVALPRRHGCAARNAGLRAVDAPYVALTDDDAWWEPGALAAAADALDRHPRLAVVNARILVGPYEREDPLCAEMARSPLPPLDGQPGHPLLSFIACAAVVRRRAILEVGGFEGRLGIGGEEELLGWDLVAAGWQLSYLPEVVAHHDPPPAAGCRPRRRVCDLRNRLWITWLRRPAGTAVRRTVQELRRAGATGVTLRAIAGTLAGVPWVARRRRVSPPQVEAMRRLLERQPRPSSSPGRR